MGEKKFDIKDRTFEFGVRVVKLVMKFPRNTAGFKLGEQLIDAGTSVGANVEEADDAHSKKDFIYKMGIARREAKESTYWLRIVKETGAEFSLGTWENRGAEVRSLDVFQTKEVQVNNHQDQCQGRHKQIDICFHDLYPPSINIIEKYKKQTTSDRRKKINIRNIPFNHVFTPVSKMSETIIDIITITKDIPSVGKKPKTFWGRTNSGEITPAVNQATARLPEISESLSNCLEFGSITLGSITRREKDVKEALSPEDKCVS